MAFPLVLSADLLFDALSLLSRPISWLVLIVGLIACFRWFRQPDTSRNCVMALFLPLVGLLSVPVVAMVQLTPRTGGVPRYMLLGPLVAAVCGIVAGLRGLAELRRPDNQAARGRSRATVGLLLSLAILLVPASAWVSSRGMEIGAGRVRAKGNRPGEPHVNIPLNFRFTPPGATWVEIDIQKANPDATVGYVQRRPLRTLVIVAEEAGIEMGLGAEQMKEFLQGYLRSAQPSVRYGEARTCTVDGIEGIEWSAEIPIGRHRETSILWVGAHNGYGYQLIYGTKDRGVSRKVAAQLSNEARRVFWGFRILDRERTAHASGVEPIQTFDSENFGYRLHFSRTGWVRVSPKSPYLTERGIDFGELGDMAEAVFMRGFQEFSAVVPIYLMGRNVRPEAVSKALLHAADKSDFGFGKLERREGREGAFHAVDYDFAGGVGPEGLQFRLKTLVGEGYAYLLLSVGVTQGADARGGAPPPLPRFEFLKPNQPPDPEGLGANERARHGLILNALGLHYYANNQYGESAAWFRVAYDSCADPDYLNNLVDSLGYDGRFKDAMTLLEKHAARFPDAKHLHANYAWVLGNVDRVDEAIQKYEELFAEGYRSANHLEGYVNLLNSAGRAGDALAAIREYAGDTDATWRVRSEADLLRTTGKQDEAVRCLEAAVDKRPFEAQLVHTLIDHYLSAHRYREGLEAAVRLIDRGYGAARSHLLKGRCEFGLKWYKKAKASFEAALTKSPEDAGIRGWLTHVSNVLGEGRNTVLRKPIPPVPLPAGLAEAVASEWVETPPLGSGACYLRWIVAVHFVPKKDCRITRYLSVRVMDESGVSAFSSFALGFDPWTESIHVNRLEVFDPDGHRVAAGKVDDCYVLDKGAELTSSQEQIAHVPVPGLRPGARIEFVYTICRSPPPARTPFLCIGLSADRPVDRAAVVFTGATNTLASHASDELKREEVETGMVWSMRRPPERRNEPYRSSERFLPHVAIGDRRASWAEVARDYLEEIVDRRPVAPPVQALAERLTADSKSDDEKVLALVRHVQRSLTYKAIAFGRRARVMNPASEILENRYGDCKDHALLLVQLLEAAGIPAHLALVDHNSPVYQDIPSIEQFSHMIVYVPGFRGGRFLDATDKEANFELDPPYGLVDRDALVLDPQNPRLTRLPAYPGDAFRTQVQEDATLQAEGHLEVRSVITAHGHMASILRYHLKHRDELGRRAWVQALLGPRAELHALKIRDMEECSRPLMLDLRYRIPGAFRRDNGRLEGILPARWDRHHYQAEFVPDRISPFQLRYPCQFDTSITLRGPKGWTLPESGALSAQNSGKWLTWNIRAERGEDALLLHISSARRAGRFSAAEYEAFRQETESVRRALAPNLELRSQQR